MRPPKSVSGQPAPAAERFAEALCSGIPVSADPVTVTWLNHWSLQRVQETRAGRDALAAMTYIGVDGALLCKMLRLPITARTSADLVIPQVLARLPGARVAIVGGSQKTADVAADHLSRLLADSAEICSAVDGYGGLAEQRRNWQGESEMFDLLILGLGSPLQEVVAHEAAEARVAHLILTCGGFLDQVANPGYYPRWAYPLRLNWAVRLVREPARLRRRYTVDAAAAYRARVDLREGLTANDGYARYLAVAHHPRT